MSDKLQFVVPLRAWGALDQQTHYNTVTTD